MTRRDSLKCAAISVLAGTSVQAQDQTPGKVDLNPPRYSDDRILISGLPTETYWMLRTAVNAATQDLDSGNFTVKLDRANAELLMFAIGTDLRTNFVRDPHRKESQ